VKSLVCHYLSFSPFSVVHCIVRSSSIYCFIFITQSFLSQFNFILFNKSGSHHVTLVICHERGKGGIVTTTNATQIVRNSSLNKGNNKITELRTILVTDYLCRVCRCHNPALSSFMTYNKSNMMGSTSRAGTVFLS
jgi:hypothetical protein